ncbi:MAG TPA: carbonic anhydrase [Candidatus Acidoferrales bacterium]|nr:carbonic anhydrase [Candidatus Acidoferrales bacterium]
MNYDRRTFLLQASAGLALCASAAPANAAGGSPPYDAKRGLEVLMAGNARFAAGKPACTPLTARRAAIAAGQNPFAMVLSCSDSRVPVDTIFDQEPGTIFGVRDAGNFVERTGLGSFEYGILVLNVPLMLILGHSDCGAVKAALAYDQHGEKQSGYIQYLVERIAPGIKGSANLSAAVAANVRANMHAATSSDTIAKAAAEGKVTIAGGVYDLHSGKVTLLA